MSSRVKAGFSKIDITPPLNSIAAHGIGYWYHRHVRFEGVRDPLFVRTVVIEADNGRHVVSAVDSILDSYSFIPAATARIAKAFHIDEGNVFITCTHTHSAPMIKHNGTRLGSEYGPFVADRIVESALEANRKLNDCRVKIGAGRIDNVLYNRRPLLKNGRIAELHASLSPEDVMDPGVTNPTVTIVKFCDGDGVLKGALCHFGIHGVAIQCSELISSDSMGRAIQAVEAEFENQAILLHLNGPCGDIDPLLMGDETALEIMSRRLQAGITSILHSDDADVEVPSRLAAVRAIFRAKRRETRSPAVLEKERNALLAATAEDAGTSHHSGAGYEAFLLSEEEQVSKLPTEIDISYQILKWGRLVLLGVGGEIFTRQGLALQSAFPDWKFLPVGLTGGAAGYLPAAEMYRQGGYEVACAQWCPIAPGEAERLFARIEDDLRMATASGFAT